MCGCLNSLLKLKTIVKSSERVYLVNPEHPERRSGIFCVVNNRRMMQNKYMKNTIIKALKSISRIFEYTCYKIQNIAGIETNKHG